MNDTLEQFIEWVSRPDVIQIFAIVLATMIAHFVAVMVLKRAHAWALGTETVWDNALLDAIRFPATSLIWVLGISWAAELISSEVDTGIQELVSPVRYILVVSLLALFLTRFVRQCEKGFVAKGADITTAEAIGKLLRISVIITAALTVLQTLGVSISGLLAFGGIGGIAVGFAAKDLLANFFGGLVIYLDRPFAVGDWVRSPDRNIEGTVETIGWRLTVIRTFDQRPLYVPNGVFSSISLENPSRMRNRRIYETIGVRYDDFAHIPAIVRDVREMLIADPDIDTEQRTLIVNFNAFNASSLDFFVYTFTKTTNWVEFHGIKERVLLAIHDIITKHGAEVAYPTTTVHLASPAAEPE